MKYLSVCSGIEAATVAWHPLGWESIAFSEIEEFPSAVLNHHYPDIPNLGDMTEYKEWNLDLNSIDLLVGGTPCQSFSLAGLRKGLADPRGNLMLVYGALAAHYKPKWIVWENVPGVLSSFSGEEPESELQPGQVWETVETSDFGGFLAMLAELGYGFAYRILDAQYIRVQSHPRAVPQRRRRVFVVGYLGDWRRAAEVLFESESLCRYPAPRRDKGERATGTLAARTSGGGGLGTDFDLAGGIQVEYYDNHAQDSRVTGSHEVGQTVSNKYGTGGGNIPLVAHTLNARGGSGWMDGESETFIPKGYHTTGDGYWKEGGGTLRAREQESHEHLVADTLTSSYYKSGRIQAGNSVGMTNPIINGYRVRRLLPEECERLQGFKTGYTRIPWKNKSAELCPDSLRYKAVGNSMAVNVMSWIGKRIDHIEKSRIPYKVFGDFVYR
jgi:DNA (cytosine-5)-methyltransferase 1